MNKEKIRIIAKNVVKRKDDCIYWIDKNGNVIESKFKKGELKE